MTKTVLQKKLKSVRYQLRLLNARVWTLTKAAKALR